MQAVAFRPAMTMPGAARQNNSGFSHGLEPQKHQLVNTATLRFGDEGGVRAIFYVFLLMAGILVTGIVYKSCEKPISQFGKGQVTATSKKKKKKRPKPGQKNLVNPLAQIAQK